MSLVSWILNGKKDTDIKLSAQLELMVMLRKEVAELKSATPDAGNLGPRVQELEKELGIVRGIVKVLNTQTADDIKLQDRVTALEAAIGDVSQLV